MIVPLNNIYKVDTSIENNKNFIKMTLGEIFSANISTRFKSNFPDYNKILNLSFNSVFFILCFSC